MRRRALFQSALGAGLTLSVSPAGQPAGGKPISLGYDTFTLSRSGWKAHQHLDYAASQKLDAVQFSSLNVYENYEPAYLQKVKDYAARLGIVIESGMDSICPTSGGWIKKPFNEVVDHLRLSIGVCQNVGAKIIRCYVGSGADRSGPIPIEGHIENTIKALKAVRTQALDAGVKFAVENHAGDLLARELKALIVEAGTDFVGACMDTGNPVWTAEDPLLTIEVLGPHTLTTHMRDSIVYEHPKGAMIQWVGMGEGQIDFKTMMVRYRELCPGAAFHLEVISDRPRLLNYLEPEFWRVYPKMPAADFARFVDLAKRGRAPEAAPPPPAPATNSPDDNAARAARQRANLERSLSYAKNTLGVGIRWKSV